MFLVKQSQLGTYADTTENLKWIFLTHSYLQGQLQLQMLRPHVHMLYMYLYATLQVTVVDQELVSSQTGPLGTVAAHSDHL